MKRLVALLLLFGCAPTPVAVRAPPPRVVSLGHAINPMTYQQINAAADDALADAFAYVRTKDAADELTTLTVALRLAVTRMNARDTPETRATARQAIAAVRDWLGER